MFTLADFARVFDKGGRDDDASLSTLLKSP